MSEAFEARKDTAVFLGEVYQRAEDALGGAGDDAAMLARVLGHPRAARQHAEFPHQAHALVAVEGDERGLGDDAVRPLVHEVRPFPLAPLVFGQELGGRRGRVVPLSRNFSSSPRRAQTACEGSGRSGLSFRAAAIKRSISGGRGWGTFTAPAKSIRTQQPSRCSFEEESEFQKKKSCRCHKNSRDAM